MLSSIVYSAVGGMAFILVLIMQLVVFAGVYTQKERLLGMIGLQPDGAGGRMGRAIAGRSRGVLSRTMRKALPFGVGFGIGRRSGRNQTTQHSGSSGTSTASAKHPIVRIHSPSNRSRRNRQSRISVGVWAKRSARLQIRRPALKIRQQKPHKRSRICRLMRNTPVRSNVESARESVRETMQNAVKAALHSLNARRNPQRQAAAEEMSARREQSRSNAPATTTQSNPAPERATVEKPPRQSQPETQ